MGTGDKKWLRLRQLLESPGREGKAGKQISNKCIKSAHNIIKAQRWNISSHLMGQGKSPK